MFNLRFKKARLRVQFWTALDLRLVWAICALFHAVLTTLAVRLVITCVNRTAKENARVGGKTYSAHLFKCAVDIRMKDLSAVEIEFIRSWLTANLDPEVFYWIIHGKGDNKHLHINVRYGFRKAA
jgi:hypothetical protein